MTVQATPNFVDYVGDDVTTVFPFTFRVDDVSWLSVDFTDDFDQFNLNLDQETNPGGNATYLVAPPSPGMGGPDPSFQILRTVPADQETAYTRYDPFDSESHENALDKLTMILQDQVTVIAVGDAFLQAGLDQEIIDRMAADVTLQNNIDAEAATRLGNDNTEIALRIAGDAAVTAAYIAADNLQQIDIDANNLLITTGGSPGHTHVLADITDYVAPVGTVPSGTVEGQFLRWNNTLMGWETTPYVFPAADGNNLDVLVSDGAGNLTFQAQGGGGGTPGGADTQVQYNNAGAFAGSDGMVWSEANRRLTIDRLGGSGAAIKVDRMLANTPALEIGGAFSSSTNYIIWRCFDQAASFWQMVSDHSLSSGNHKLEIQSSALGTNPFIEFDASGEMTLGGAQNLGSLQLTGIAGTRKMICLANGNGGLYMDEQAASGAVVAGDGQFWVRNDAPNTPMFTDDTGVDHVLNGGGNPFASIRITEQAGFPAGVAAEGLFWVRDRTVCQPWFTDDASVARPLAFAVARRVATNGNWDMNAGASDYNSINGIAVYDDGAAYTVTTEDSGSLDWPIDCSFQIVARGAGVISILEGSGVTLYVDDGTGFVDSAGGCTLSNGVCTVYRTLAGEVRVWGSGLTP